MATTVMIDKLLATVIQMKASDLHISVGQPPVIRHHGRMRRLDTKVLDNDDTTALMKSITPDRCQQELQTVGGADFAIEFTDGVRFRVAIYKQKGIAAGIRNAIRFFMGIEVTIEGTFGFGTASLGDATLDLDFVLGSSNIHDLLSFTVTSPVILTQVQVAQMTSIIEFMQRAEEHLAAIIQPAAPPVIPDHVELGLSNLDETWILH